MNQKKILDMAVLISCKVAVSYSFSFGVKVGKR